MPRILTHLQRDVISYLIAENEEQDEENPLTSYLYALSGGFLPDMQFTLCRDRKSGIVLYVQDSGDTGAQLRKRCGELKRKLLDIADCIRYLVEQGYVRTIIKEAWEDAPRIPEHWYGYDDFTPEEIAALGCACSVQLIPRFTLYTYWEGRKQPVLCSH